MDGVQCGFVDCELSAVGSRPVRGTVWFAAESRMSPENGERQHWILDGYIEPVTVMVAVHLCEHHFALVEVES